MPLILFPALLVISVWLLNANTFHHQYALDDEMVITKNMSVQQGFEGIPKIMSTDAYQSFLDISGSNSPLTGGRYRPLSIVSFAIEQQLLGKTYGNDYLQALAGIQQVQQTGANLNQLEGLRNQLIDAEKNIAENNRAIAPARHLLQVVYYSLLIVAIWYLLHYFIFTSHPVVAFLAALLFAFHPLHTEVVANLKSRDEIFSLLFIVLTLIFVFRYNRHNTPTNLLGITVCFLLALLSKEYALLIPVLAAACAWLYLGQKPNHLRSNWFYLLCTLTIGFLFFRYSIIGQTAAKTISSDLINNPYALATPVQKLATKIYVCFEYIKLLVFPHPLSSDYSFHQIAYVGFTHPQVILSMLFFTAIGALLVYLFYKRNTLAFPLLFFVGFFFLINNLLFDIGATMGERLIFHSSLGFCMLLASGIHALAQKVNAPRSGGLALAATALLLVPMSYKTVTRNADWHDNFTLFTSDAHNAPNSAMTNCNAGGEYFNKGYLQIKNKGVLTRADSVMIAHYADTAIGYLTKAVAIYPNYTNALMNLGICYYYKGDLQQAAIHWRAAARLFNGVHPTLAVHAKVLLTNGIRLGSQKEYAQAAQYLGYASEMDPLNIEIWTNLGGSQFAQGNFEEASTAFKKALELNSGLQEAQQGFSGAEAFLKLQQDCYNNAADKTLWLANANTFKQYGFYKTAYDLYNHVLSLDPTNAEALAGSNATRGRENKK